MHYNDYYGMMNGSEYGFGWFMGLCLIVLVIIVISMVAYLLSKQHRDWNQTLPKPHLEIIKERYAKGEINKEEFEQLKKDLS